MRISPIIPFRINLIIYAIFDKDLSHDLYASKNIKTDD